MSWTSTIAGAASAFFLITAAHALGSNAPAATPTSSPPAGPGLDLINERCTFCHTSASIFAEHKTRDDWAATVQAMADRGADVSPEEMKTIVDYLAANYTAAPDTTAAAAAGEKQ
ncbi:MAG TPA: hypothetical protein VM657_09685 [Sphingomonas sp.]|nr:hypothetical protein [Sphingomonas sp.]